MIVLMCLSTLAGARELPKAGEVPRVRLYKRLIDDGGPVRGRFRRSSARWWLWELRDGTVVRAQLREGGAILEDRRFDAAGWPLAAFREPGPEAGSVPRVVVQTVPERELVLSGWARQDIPGGSVLAPLAPLPREGGGAQLLVLGGALDVWHDPSRANVYGADFREGLLGACGCVLVDQTATWVDGKPGVRFRLEVPDRGEVDLLDLWAVPAGAGASGGIWLASYRVRGIARAAGDDSAAETLAMGPGRALISLVTLDALAGLGAPEAP